MSYRNKFFNAVLDCNNKTSCGIAIYPIFYCVTIGFTLGILKEYGKIKIPDVAIAGISLGVLFGLLSLGVMTLLAANYAKLTADREEKYSSAATNPATWVCAAAAYVIGAPIDGVIAIKHYISKN